MIRRIFPILISFLLLGTPSWAKLNVVATLPWIGSLAGDLGGDRVKVATLVKPNQDPHYVEAKPSMILEVRKADLLALQWSGFGSRLSSRAGGIIPESENPAGKSRFFGLFPIHRGPGPAGTGRPEHGGRPPAGESSLSSLSKKHLAGGRRNCRKAFRSRPGRGNFLPQPTGFFPKPAGRKTEGMGKNILGGEKIPSLS